MRKRRQWWPAHRATWNCSDKIQIGNGRWIHCHLKWGHDGLHNGRVLKGVDHDLAWGDPRTKRRFQ